MDINWHEQLNSGSFYVYYFLIGFAIFIVNSVMVSKNQKNERAYTPEIIITWPFFLLILTIGVIVFGPIIIIQKFLTNNKEGD